MEALSRAVRERDVGHFPDLPIAYNATPSHPALDALPLTTLTVAGSGERLTVTNLDGHHRLLVMEPPLGIERCSMMTIWDPEWLERIQAVRGVANYDTRMYQYLAGLEVDEPVLTASPPDETFAV